MSPKSIENLATTMDDDHIKRGDDASVSRDSPMVRMGKCSSPPIIVDSQFVDRDFAAILQLGARAFYW